MTPISATKSALSTRLRMLCSTDGSLSLDRFDLKLVSIVFDVVPGHSCTNTDEKGEDEHGGRPVE